MKFLKSKIVLTGLKYYPALSSFEICEKIRPYLRPFRLSLTKDKIVFPEEKGKEQTIICLMNAPEIYVDFIPFDQILWAEERREGLHLYVRTGHVFFFPREGKVWRITNLYKYGEPWRVTVWWWAFSGWICLWWNKLRRPYKKREKTLK